MNWLRNGAATTSGEGERKTFLRQSMRAELGLGILGKIFIFLLYTELFYTEPLVATQSAAKHILVSGYIQKQCINLA